MVVALTLGDFTVAGVCLGCAAGGAAIMAAVFLFFAIRARR